MIWLAAAILGVALVILARRHRQRQRTWKEEVLGCEHTLLTQCSRRFAPDGMPVLSGRFRGREVELRVFRDDLAFRKLPNLWLSVSTRESLPHMPTVDILARAQNNEFYSPGSELPHRIDVPCHWPGELTLRSDADTIALESLSSHVSNFFSDARAKQILIRSTGLRLLFQLAQARRAEYLVLRSGFFDISCAPASLVNALLQQASGMVDELKGLRGD